MNQSIIIKGARENNLQNVSLSIPKNKFIVITGPSGSGKSTLAMDTLQRECQRLYMESMGMNVESMSKPKVDSIEGLSPSISIIQQQTNRNPRSTVGTTTDIYTFLRLMYEQIGQGACPHCEGKLHFHSLHLLEEGKKARTCPTCHESLEKLTRSHFSFNTPEGACSTCEGLGETMKIDESLVFNEELSLRDGAVTIWYKAYLDYQLSIIEQAAKHYGLTIDLDVPMKNFQEEVLDLISYGVESEQFSKHFLDITPPKAVGKGKLEGVLSGMWRRYKEKGGQSGEAEMFIATLCPDCHGQKLKKESREITINNLSIIEVAELALDDVLQWLLTVEKGLTESEAILIGAVIHDLKVKVKRIMNVGLSYLSLNRQMITLSGGEAQRLRLANVLGSGLTGVLYILDEPSSGLHAKDIEGLLIVLQELRDLGNTILVIEHNPAMIKAADHIIDIGPGAGHLGGQIVGEGTFEQLLQQEHSITGKTLKEIPVMPTHFREGNGKSITIHRATKHNLKDVTTSIPLGKLISVSGVSGSGKSTLIFDLLSESENKVGVESIEGLEHIDKMITVNQTPLSKMQRSNIATYTDAFTQMRNLFASLPLAKERNLKPKDFSFNTPGGRCEHCQGLGFVTLDLYFLADLEVTCPVCHGKRFEKHVLEITYKDKSISSILDMTIEESKLIFQEEKKLSSIINLLCEIGLGYLHWGQSVTTLSGGEAQRIKLTKELMKKSTGHTLYLLDEPTTGLHPSDVNNLMLLLNKLVDSDNTVLVVEHNLHVIKQSDWVIDLGPLGGKDGGMIVAEGTPATVKHTKGSFTGSFL